MPVVLDCSAVMRWWVPGADAPWSPGEASGERFLAPELLRVEWANALGKLVSFRGLKRSDAEAYRDRLERLDTRWVPDADLLEGAWDLALSTHLSIYDALYVHLARAVGAPLATADGKMSKVAKDCGVPVRWAGE